MTEDSEGNQRFSNCLCISLHFLIPSPLIVYSPASEQTISAEQMQQLLKETSTHVEVPKQVKEAMAKVESMGKEKYPRATPVIKLNLQYKPMDVITKAAHYFKYVPPVYSDAPNFDFADKDYEIRERDKLFLRELNDKIAQGSGSIACAGG